MSAKLLTGRSARIIVTMGMPAPICRLFFRAHRLKSLDRNLLRFVGLHQVRYSLIRRVEGRASSREKWVRTVARLGGDATQRNGRPARQRPGMERKSVVQRKRG